MVFMHEYYTFFTGKGIAGMEGWKINRDDLEKTLDNKRRIILDLGQNQGEIYRYNSKKNILVYVRGCDTKKVKPSKLILSITPHEY